MELLLLLFFFFLFLTFLEIEGQGLGRIFFPGKIFFVENMIQISLDFVYFYRSIFIRWIKNLSSLRVIIILKRMRIRGHPRIIIEIIIERIIIRIKSGTRLLHGLMGKPFCVKWCFVRRMHKYIGGDELYTLKRQV